MKLGVIDTLAQLGLYEDEPDRCGDYIAEAAKLRQLSRLPAASWYDLSHHITRCAYHERIGEWSTIVSLCDSVDAELVRRQYRALRTSLLCAKARALGRLGATDEAERALALAVRSCPRGAVDPLIVLEASKGVLAAIQADPSGAAAHFDRALAGCRAIGHRYHEAWIERQRTELEGAGRSTVSVPARSLDLSNTALLMTDVSTVLGAGHSIDLLAHRTVSILQGTPLGRRLTVDTESGCEFLAEPTATCESQTDGTFRIQLRGSDRRVTIRVAGVKQIDEISLLKSVSDIVQIAMNRAVDTEHEDENQNLWPRTPVPTGDDRIFRSPQMVELIKIAIRLASTELPILITGETGTGKEVLARLIHEYSRVKRGPFVPFNCSATPRDLVESQLFGHRRGAFTGAHESFSGVIRAAERGTLFLDEVGDLDVGVQPKLLRFLESSEIHPLGELRPHTVSVRVVAATNANLDTLIEAGRFRADLFYRIGVVTLALPPLRDRKDEIPALASRFVSKYAQECQRAGLRMGDDFIAALLLYNWPGNIRELANEIRRVVAMAEDGETLSAQSLAPAIMMRWNERPAAVAPGGPSVHIRLDQTLAGAINELEQHFITHALRASGGRVTDAANLLGLSRKGLFLKRRRRGLVASAVSAD